MSLGKTQKMLRRSNNTDKTENTLILKSEGWKEENKVGSLVHDDKDVKIRKQLATVTLNKHDNVFIIGNKPKISTKIELYKIIQIFREINTTIK